MTLKENIRYILRKFPATRHSRSEFAWHYIEQFYEVKIYVLKVQFQAFFKDWAGIERAYREILKEKEFQLSPEEDAKRYEKASEFRAEYKK